MRQNDTNVADGNECDETSHSFPSATFVSFRRIGVFLKEVAVIVYFN